MNPPSDTTRTCPDCWGTKIDPRRFLHDGRPPCPTCKGTGQIDAKRFHELDESVQGKLIADATEAANKEQHDLLHPQDQQPDPFSEHNIGNYFVDSAAASKVKAYIEREKQAARLDELESFWTESPPYENQMTEASAYTKFCDRHADLTKEQTK